MLLAVTAWFLLSGQTPAPPAVPAGNVATLDSARLDAAVNRLMADSPLGETRALIVMHHGQIIAERYAPGFSASTRFLSWSMAKSVTAVLAGQLAASGQLKLDAPAPVAAWSKPDDPRRAITVRQLLTMSAGLRHRESGPPLADADTNRMLFLDGARDTAGFAAARQLETTPGSAFVYSSATSAILSGIITRAVTREQDPLARARAVRRWMDAVLFRPAGLSSFTPEFDASGTFLGGSFMHATARDWARFGDLMRQDGMLDGQRIVAASWLSEMRTPAATNAGYGGHIWLNRVRTDGGEPVLFPGKAPASLFACVGHLGQYVLVSPDQALTVVRLGKTPDDARAQLAATLGDLVALFPVERT